MLSGVFSFSSGFGIGKQSALSALLFAYEPDPRETLPTPFPSLPSSVGRGLACASRALEGVGGLTCPSGGFHREIVAEDEKELKKQKKEEERKKSQEITRDQEEVV